MDDFQPMRFGRRLWIVPSNREVPVEASGDDAVVLRLDPGLAFGTGTHATTAQCLTWLDGLDLAGRRVLDFGAGSGVLALAAARLGAVAVDAVDNDPQALTATQANAEANGADDRIRAIAAEHWDPGDGYDVIVANILANTLIDLAPRLTAALRPGASIALSGILPEQGDEVSAAYAGQNIPLACSEQDGWLLLASNRHDEPAAAALDDAAPDAAE